MALSEATMRTGILGWRSGLLTPGAARALGTAPPAPAAPVPPVTSRPSFPPVRSLTPVTSGVGSMMDGGDAPLS